MNRPVIVAGLFAVVALIALGLALGVRSADQERLDDARRVNCLAIEQLKELERRQLAEDITAATQFLRDNPKGAGPITPKVLLASIARDQRQLRGLEAREC